MQVEPKTFIRMLWIHKEVNTMLYVTEDRRDPNCFVVEFSLLKSVSSVGTDYHNMATWARKSFPHVHPSADAFVPQASMLLFTCRV